MTVLLKTAHMTKISAVEFWVSLGERCADTGQNMDIADTQSSVNTTHNSLAADAVGDSNADGQRLLKLSDR